MAVSKEFRMSQAQYSSAFHSFTMGLEEYARAYKNRYEGSLVGNDYVMFQGFKLIAQGIISLCDGETGRHDAAEVIRKVKTLCKENGIDLNEVDE